MAVDLAGFRTRFPEFVLGTYGDARVQLALDDAALQINVGLWGNKAELGQYYLAAHALSFDTGYGIGLGSFGPIASETVGSVSRTYATNGAYGSAYDADFLLSKYGMLYLRLKRTILATPVVL